MQFNYGNSANYLAGGAKVADTYLDTYNTSQETGIDPNKLIQAQSKARKQKQVNAIDQVNTVGQTALDIQTGVKITDMDAKLKKDIRNINRPAKMAGALAATVDTGNAYLMYDKERKLKLKEDADEKAYRQKQLDLLITGNKSTEALNAKKIKLLEQRIQKAGKEFNQLGAQPTNSSDTTQTISSNSTTAPVQVITPSGGTIDRKEVYKYITKDLGLSHNKAYGLMANIDRESSFTPNIRSGDDQGPGGLFQWKGVRQTPTVAKLVNSGDWKGQIKYAINEPGEPSMQTFLNTTWKSPEAAAAHITRKFERPANPDNDILKNNQFIAGYNFQ